jgi:hypothetical protein
MADKANITGGNGSNVVPLNNHHANLGRIEMELVDIEALIDSLRLMWENLDRHDPALTDDLQRIAVTVSYVIKDKIGVALKSIPGATVHRVKAGRAR